MNRLQGKRALITGGTSGIGLETARLFLAEGARVAVTGRTAESVAAAARELGSDLVTLASDAADSASQKELAAQVAQRLGRLDVLFVNAGVVDMRPIEQFDPDACDRSIAIHLKGPYFLIQALLPHFC